MKARNTLVAILICMLGGLAAAQDNADQKSPEQIRQEKLAALQGLVNQGNAAFRAERFEEARSLYKQSLDSKDPVLPADQRLIVQGNLAGTCYRMENWAEAIECYRRCALEDSMQWIAQCHVQMENLPEAAFALRSALILFPERVALKTQLAQITAMLGQEEEALALYKELLLGSPMDPELYLALANRHIALGQSREALDALEMSWRLGARKSSTARLMGDLYMGEGMRLEAAGYYRKYFSMSQSTSAEDHFRIGFAYYQGGEAASAREFFELATALDTSYANAFLYLGHLAHSEKNETTALKEYKRATELDPSLVTGFEAIGAIEARRGNRAASLEAYEQAIAVGGADFSTHFNVIQAQLQLEARPAALAALKRAFHSFPERRELRALLEALKQARNSG